MVGGALGAPLCTGKRVADAAFWAGAVDLMQCILVVDELVFGFMEALTELREGEGTLHALLSTVYSGVLCTARVGPAADVLLFLWRVLPANGREGSAEGNLPSLHMGVVPACSVKPLKRAVRVVGFPRGAGEGFELG